MSTSRSNDDPVVLKALLRDSFSIRKKWSYMTAMNDLLRFLVLWTVTVIGFISSEIDDLQNMANIGCAVGVLDCIEGLRELACPSLILRGLELSSLESFEQTQSSDRDAIRLVRCFGTIRLLISTSRIFACVGSWYGSSRTFLAWNMMLSGFVLQVADW